MILPLRYLELCVFDGALNFKISENMNHCVKIVRIWSYSGPHFSRIFPHSAECWYFSVFSPNAGKLRTRITPNTDTLRSEYHHISLESKTSRTSRFRSFLKECIKLYFHGKYWKIFLKAGFGRSIVSLERQEIQCKLFHDCSVPQFSARTIKTRLFCLL